MKDDRLPDDADYGKGHWYLTTILQEAEANGVPITHISTWIETTDNEITEDNMVVLTPSAAEAMLKCCGVRQEMKSEHYSAYLINEFIDLHSEADFDGVMM